MKKVLLGLAAVVLIASGVFLLYYNWQDKSDLGDPPVITIPSDNDSTALDDEVIPGNADNMDQDDSVIWDNESGIWVDQDIIVADENALRVSGQANTFEATVNMKLYGDDGILIQEDFTTAEGGMGVVSDFEKVMYFAAPEPHIVNGYLEVFEYSAMDGSETNKVTVPVYFAYNDTTTLTVHFSHSAPAGSPGECTYLQTVERETIGTLAVAKATLQAMLLGPRADEEAQGFFSGIPSGTTLNSISISNGIAYADFSSELNSTAGSCGVAGVTAMIRANLLQFDTVDDVVISVEGETEDILQP